MRKHGSSTLRPESLRKTTRAFHVPVNVRWGACPEPVEGLREDSGRSEERGGRRMLKHLPPRSGLNPCGKQPGLFMCRSMFGGEPALSLSKGSAWIRGRSEERGGRSMLKHRFLHAPA